jgi:hypothetical protein
MEERPRSITIISWLFIVFGSIALLSGVAQRPAELKSHWYVHLSRILQIVAGVFMLRGHNWARWLLVAWIAFHIVVAAMHSALFLLMHVLILLCNSLFRLSPAGVDLLCRGRQSITPTIRFRRIALCVTSSL